jgi:hypothetical protein
MKQENHLVKLPPFTVKKVVSTLSQTVDWGLINLNIPETWSITKGKGIVVLVIDTGCPCKNTGHDYIIHSDLKDCVDLGRCKSFIPDEGIEDLQGHSTHCCGVIGARDNEIGCVGYAPECTIVTYKGLNRHGSGTLEQITAALEYAADVLKPDVISMSLGSTEPYEPMHRAIQKLYKMNIPIITAGGNGGEAEGVNYPGQYEETITIGAYDINNDIAYFSAVGDKIDFAFPGVDIYSTYLNGGYSRLSGTSMATPACAGVVALLIAKHKKQEKETGVNDCKTVDQIKEHLKKYSVDAGKIGKDKQYGYGIVDVEKMLINRNCSSPINTPENPLMIPKPKKKNIFNWIFGLFRKPYKINNIEGFNGVIGSLTPILDENGHQKYNTGMLWYRITLFDYTTGKDKLTFKDKKGVEYRLDNHFETDGGSIPPCLRLLPFAHLDPFNFTRTYLYHDCAYQFGGLYIKYPGEEKFKFRLMTRKEANDLLATTLKYDNATWFDRTIINTGLKAGSMFVWDTKRKPKKQKEQRRINKISVYDKNGYLIEYNNF